MRPEGCWWCLRSPGWPVPGGKRGGTQQAGRQQESVGSLPYSFFRAGPNLRWWFLAVRRLLTGTKDTKNLAQKPLFLLRLIVRGRGLLGVRAIRRIGGGIGRRRRRVIVVLAEKMREPIGGRGGEMAATVKLTHLRGLAAGDEILLDRLRA